jgi:hypothetical protein
MKNFTKKTFLKLILTIFFIIYQVSNVSGFARVISLIAASGSYSDETAIRLENEATYDFDGNWDAYKLTNGGYTPNFYTTISGINYSINSVPMTFDEYTFDLQLKVAFTGNYTITTKSLLDSYDSTLVITLEDKLLQTTQVLSENFVYEFSAATTDTSDRFVLHYRFIKPNPISNGADSLNTTSPIDSNVVVLDSNNVSSQNSSAVAQIDIQIVTDQVQVNLVDGPSKNATIGIMTSEGKIVYFNENVSSNSSTSISLNNNNPGSIYIINVISGSNVLSKKIFY